MPPSQSYSHPDQRLYSSSNRQSQTGCTIHTEQNEGARPACLISAHPSWDIEGEDFRDPTDAFSGEQLEEPDLHTDGREHNQHLGPHHDLDC